MVKNINGRNCAYGMVTREMVNETRNDIKEIKDSINQLNNKVSEIFNHQSNRLPLWATTFISLLVALVTGLGVYFLRGG